MALPEEMHVIEDDRLTELPIHYAITERTNPEGMVVLMPSALAAGRADRDKIFTHVLRGKAVGPTHKSCPFRIQLFKLIIG